MERREDLRAGDSDRQLVGDRLREALNEGRINLMEYDERLQHAYSAKTYGELDKLLDDLPKVTPAQASQMATVAPARTAPAVPSGEDPVPHERSKGWLAGIWGGWLTASLVCTGIWAATSLTSGSVHGFWPIWVIVPFGAVCVARTIGVVTGGHGGPVARDRQARLDRQARRDRRRSS